MLTEGDQVIDGNFFVNRNVSIKGDLITNDTVNDILIQDVAILGGNNTFSGVTSSQKLIANINNNNQNFKLLINSTDNDTRITEYSLHPSRNYLAIAEIDYPKLQSTTDSIKIYKLDGKLQNKILTLKPHALNWLDIPGQYWISFIENRTTLQVYQQKDENIEFLNILSYRMPSENLITVTLPYQSKLNQIPLMILHGANIVRVIKGNMAGDPYNGISPDCNI
ncbi:uncharacterized protein LOC142332420 isoform X1 [Lycorma delicatula]|uniref:uncharacterized protein LOC142332420 isoform X1 n=1 Tax=Lycorma delicatula TaxID=130591 RepID=UPI003F516DF9